MSPYSTHIRQEELTEFFLAYYSKILLIAAAIIILVASSSNKPPGRIQLKASLVVNFLFN